MTTNKKGKDFFYIPVPRIDPCSFSRIMIDEVHLPVEVLGDVPSFRKRYLPIPSPWHISLRSKSIQNLSLYRRAVDGRISVRAYTRFSDRIYNLSLSLVVRSMRRTGENETGKLDERVGMNETASNGDSGAATKTAIKRIAHTYTRGAASICTARSFSRTLSLSLWLVRTTPPSCIPHYHERSDVRIPAFRFLSSGIPPLT